ncbi:MAG: hypothetical protein L3J52_10410, partial [Proteobacteria bacterium]|nr:hypothetical protein [Pseudomonadota bacterium]
LNLVVDNASLGISRGSDAGFELTNKSAKINYSGPIEKLLDSGSLSIKNLDLTVFDDKDQQVLQQLTTSLLVEQDEFYRGISLVIEDKNIADRIEVRAVGSKKYNFSKNVELYFDIKNLKVQQLSLLYEQLNLPNLVLNGELWFKSNDGVITSSNGILNITDPKLDFNAKLRVEHSGSTKNWQLLVRMYDIELADQPLNDVYFKVQRSGRTSIFTADNLSVSMLNHWYNSFAEDRMKNYSLQSVAGILEDVQIQWDHSLNKFRNLDMKFKNVAGLGESFDLANLAGQLKWDGVEITVGIDSEEGSLRLPNIFRGQLNWNKLYSQIVLNIEESEKSVQVTNFWCDCEDFILELNSVYTQGEEKHLNLVSIAEQVDVSQLKKYWPNMVWNEKTINWLDSGIVSGQVSKGVVFYQGQIIKDGFANNLSVFQSKAYLENISSNFHADWPLARNMFGIANFHNDSVKVKLSAANTLGLKINQAEVEIEHYAIPILGVKLSGSGFGNQLMRYIASSPLSNSIKNHASMKLDGLQTFNILFDVPLAGNRGVQDLSPKGLIHFAKGKFKTSDFELTDIEGDLLLDGFDLSMKDVSARLQGTAVKVSGNILTTQMSDKDPKTQLDIELKGDFDLNNMLNEFGVDIPVSGSSEWQINIFSQENDEMAFRATSDLMGVTSQLPAPLAKNQDDRKSLVVSCQFPCDDNTMDIEFDEKISTQIIKKQDSYELLSMILNS